MAEVKECEVRVLIEEVRCLVEVEVREYGARVIIEEAMLVEVNGKGCGLVV